MKLEFAKWLKNEVATTTSSIAVFAQPLMGVVRRKYPPEFKDAWTEEDPFFNKNKNHKKSTNFGNF